ncbi:glutathione S-transferase N-terminal domain-containing protein [Microdochium nivale]|nr:glutathione S-transferase N-terminal domain-containing protein [Microdochium nivale]
MAVQDLPIVLYTYPGSPYGQRLVWYLNLRRIPFKTCLQPPILPRRDVELLGLNYRRIPLATIGRDVYLDTRLIVSKLEALYPATAANPGISATTGDQRALEALISRVSIEFPGSLFSRGAQLMPPDSAFLRDPRFVRDRNQLVTGKPDAKAFTPDNLRAGRPAALVEIARLAELLETTLLADGRDWVFGTGGGAGGAAAGGGPSLGDIEAVFILHWLTTMKGALDADVIGPAAYPKVFAWIARFDGHMRKAVAKPDLVKGDEAARLVLAADFAESSSQGVLGSDPVIAAAGFKAGDLVTVWPLDQAPVNKDSGSLVAMDKDEVVIEIASKAEGGRSVRVHAPRHGFKIIKGEASAKI